MNIVNRTHSEKMPKQLRACAFNEFVKQSPIALDGVSVLRSALSLRNTKIINKTEPFDGSKTEDDMLTYDNFFMKDYDFRLLKVKPNEFIFKFKHSDFIDFIDNEGKGKKFDGGDIGFDDIWIFNDEEEQYEYAFENKKRYRIKSFGMVKTDELVDGSFCEKIHFYAVVGILRSCLFALVTDNDLFRFNDKALNDVVYLDGANKTFCKSVVTGTYDIQNRTFENRHIRILVDNKSINDPRRDELDSFSASEVHDPVMRLFDPTDHFLVGKLADKVDSTWEEYHDLYSILYEFMKLPTYSNFKFTVGYKRKYKTKPINPQKQNLQYRQVFSKVSKDKSFFEIDIQSLRYQTPQNRSRRREIKITTLRWQMSIRGFWRILKNPNTIGKDQRGDYCERGKTWVISHIRNRDLPRRDVVFRKCSVSQARKKVH